MLVYKVLSIFFNMVIYKLFDVIITCYGRTEDMDNYSELLKVIIALLLVLMN